MPQLAAPPSEPVSRPPSALQRVALVGNPNTGKTTRVQPAVRRAREDLELSRHDHRDARRPRRARRAHASRSSTCRASTSCISMRPRRGSSATCWPARTKHARPDAVVVVVDASNLARNLMLVGELLAARMPIVVCAQHDGRRGDAADRRRRAALGARLGVPVVPMVASKGIGLEALRQAIAGTLAKSSPEWPADVPAPGRDLRGHRRVGRSRHGRDRQGRRPAPAIR